MTKFYDTCYLLNHISEIFNSLEPFYISFITLQELENIKTSAHKDADIKFKARQLLHMLSEHRDLYTIILNKSSKENSPIFEYIDNFNNDCKIISCAYDLNKTEEIIFYTDDLSCMHLAEEVGLTVNTSLKQEKEYTGFMEKVLDEEELANFYSNILYSDSNPYNLLDNQYLIIKDKNNKVIDKYKFSQNKLVPIKFWTCNSNMFGKIIPKNGDIYQQLVLDSFFTNQITMVRGAAGTGKSYLSFGYMFHKLEKGEIDKIIVFCNTVATLGSAKLGYYPGSKDEKLLDSQIGNLLSSKLGDRYIVEDLISKGKLVLLPMSDIRGYDTSGMKAAVYITEAQNLDIELMRLALQRIGNDSFCILDGDSDAQVDSAMYTGAHNGMRRVSDVFKGSDIYGEVTLQNIYRSKIAELAQNL